MPKPLPWKWIRMDVVLAIHDRQLAEFGGLEGVRDDNALHASLDRPLNMAAYTPSCDAADLAAAYAYGFARSHAFFDANKRTAWVLARLFLAHNGYALRVDRNDVIPCVVSLAAGDMKQEDFAAWLRERVRPACGDQAAVLVRREGLD